MQATGNAITKAAQVNRRAEVLDLARPDPTLPSVVRGQNFTVERVPGSPGKVHSLSHREEAILICPDAAIIASGSFGEEARIVARSLAVLPAGRHDLRFEEGGECYILSTGRTDLSPAQALNASAYAEPHPKVAPLGRPFTRARNEGEVQIYPIGAIVAPADNQRMKFLQSSTMSINLVEYDGARDRSRLSPHSHADFEQASLAIVGNFVHHIRVPWGANADNWRDDEHIDAGPATILVVPPDVIHTSEGVEEGPHLLIDIFAPPRRDFREKGWIHNASDYMEPVQGA